MKTGQVLGVRTGLQKRRLLGYFFSAAFIAGAVTMLFLAVRYDPENENWAAINKLLHKRLESPHRMGLLYPPSLWGSDYVVLGWGYDPNIENFGDLFAQYGYTYIDSSYPQILIMHGYLVFAMILCVMTMVSFRYAKEGQLYPVLLLAVMAVQFAAEGHMKDISCNIWMVLPFAELSCGSKLNSYCEGLKPDKPDLT